MSAAARQGPLRGLRVVEMAGIGPAPMCAMLLADLGADVLRIARIGNPGANIRVEPRFNLSNRSKSLIEIDLKHPDGVQAALQLIDQADALIEGFRPGVMERLGLGPELCLQRNPRLVYGRMTGFGQGGPLAAEPCHDLNILALSGVLDAIGPAGGAPVIPLNLIADFGGGSLYLALGLMSALWEAQRSGRGQCVDASMLDGVASLATFLHGLTAAGAWQAARGTNPLDGGAHFYNVYRTADGRYLSVAANEPQFYARLLELLELDAAVLPAQRDRSSWPRMRELFGEIFARRTLDEWTQQLGQAGVCVAPVLDLAEARAHPQALARQAYVELDGVAQPAPAPRFSRTPSAAPSSVPAESAGRDLLEHWGFSGAAAEQLLAGGVVR
ncbi:MAG: CaiB/BaiF CoA transferase family protein [Burkholderiaceae bacterium]